jgi:hypothetical protein
MRFRRTMLLGAGALLLSGMTVGLTAAAASAKTPAPPDGPQSCAIGGTVTFASPGLSYDGTNSTTLKKTTTTASASLSGCTSPYGTTGNINGGSPENITSKSSKCTAQATPYPGCPAPVKHAPKEYNYDSVAAFQSTGGSVLAKALKKLSFTIGGTTFDEKTTVAVEDNPGGACGSEVGFTIQGTVKKPKNDKNQTVTANVCLGNDTGSPSDSGNFFLDAASASGGNTAILIATASIDPATSTISTN